MSPIDHHHGHDHHHHHHHDVHDDGQDELLLDPGNQALSQALKWLFRLLKVIMVIVVILFAYWRSVYTVEQNENAIVLRFGQRLGGEVTAIKEPGLHIKWPAPIDEIIKVSTAQRELDVDFWYFMTEKEKAGVQNMRPSPTLQFLQDRYTLTASQSATDLSFAEGKGADEAVTDYNVVHTRWRINYSVDDPVAFFESIWDGTDDGWRAVEELLANVLSDAVVVASANSDIEKIIWAEDRIFREDVQIRMTTRLAELDLGLSTTLVFVEKATPRQVQDSFDRANGARQEKDRLVDEAKGRQAELRSEAYSQAEIIVAEAEAYRTKVTESARAEANYLRAILDKVDASAEEAVAKDAPERTAKVKQYRTELLAQTIDQQYQEMLRTVMGNAQEVFVVSSTDGAKMEWRPMLNRDPMIQKRKAKAKAKRN